MFIKHDNAGFSVIESLIILATVAILSGAGFVTYRHVHNSTPSNASSNVSVHNHTSTTGTGNSGSTNFTGIYGTVTNGGCAGAVRVNGSNYCSSAPQADMIVTATNYSDKKTFSALTDSKGNYRLFANPGTYTVDTHPAKQNIIAECQESTGIVVKQSVATKLNFGCDNGLR